MQDHLKERLTGAAILVIAVVLLVPELFRGPPSANLRSGMNASAGPPVRSYTIDLRESALPQPPGASAPATAFPASIGPSALPRAAATASGAAVAGNPLPSAPALNPATPPTASPNASKTLPAVPSPHTSALRPGATKSGWIVQVGSFARRDYAERQAKQVTAKGFAVEVAGPDDRGLYRVRSAPQPAHSGAVALKQKMQASGLKPLLSTVP